jgi:class 3 adenylate cyclase
MDRSAHRGSEARLWALIEERIQPGADRARIDAEIWELFGEEWAVLITDLAGFSRSTQEFGIIHFLQIIHQHHDLLLPVIREHRGIVVKTEADNFMLLFRQPRSALSCALAMQRACRDFNRDCPEEDQILLCAGIGFGRVLRIGDRDVWGSEVNAASKLGEDTARAYEILVTGAARDALGDFPGVDFSDLGIAVPGSERNFRVGTGSTPATE